MQYQHVRVPASRTQINLVILPGGHFESPDGGVEALRQNEIGDGDIHAAYFCDRKLAHGRASSAIGLRKTPRRSISTSTVSPGFIHKGGVRFTPTPPGVPVRITSPLSRRLNEEQYSTMVGTLKIIWPRTASCTVSPLRRVVIRRSCRSPSSSGVIIQGPKLPVSGKFLPGVN